MAQDDSQKLLTSCCLQDGSVYLKMVQGGWFGWGRWILAGPGWRMTWCLGWISLELLGGLSEKFLGGNLLNYLGLDVW